MKKFNYMVTEKLKVFKIDNIYESNIFIEDYEKKLYNVKHYTFCECWEYGVEEEWLFESRSEAERYLDKKLKSLNSYIKESYKKIISVIKELDNISVKSTKDTNRMKKKELKKVYYIDSGLNIERGVLIGKSNVIIRENEKITLYVLEDDNLSIYASEDIKEVEEKAEQIKELLPEYRKYYRDLYYNFSHGKNKLIEHMEKNRLWMKNKTSVDSCEISKTKEKLISIIEDIRDKAEDIGNDKVSKKINGFLKNIK